MITTKKIIGIVRQNHLRLQGALGVTVTRQSSPKHLRKYGITHNTTRTFIVDFDTTKFTDEQLQSPNFLLGAQVAIVSCAKVSKHKYHRLLEVMKEAK